MLRFASNAMAAVALITALMPLPVTLAKIVLSELELQAAIGNGSVLELGADILLNATVVINQAASIDGKGYALDGQSRIGCLRVEYGVHLVLSNITIYRGVAHTGGGIQVMEGSTLTASSAFFLNNSATFGGAIAIFTGSNASFDESSFEFNRALDVGGGLSASKRSNVLLERCVFVNNFAKHKGGGMWLNASAAVAFNTLFQENRVENSGGGIAAFESSVILKSTRLTRNEAKDGGGLSTKVTTIVASESVFDLNSASHTGGGHYGDEGSVVHFTDCRLAMNQANYGGGNFIFAGSAAFDNCTFEKNYGLYDGGGLIFEDTNGDLRNCQVVHNRAAQAGGGVHVIHSNFQLTACNISGNQAGYAGGGIFFTSNTVANISKSTITANVAQSSSEFINMTSGACSVKDNCIFSPNYPESYGNDESCSFTVLTDAVLDAATFSTETGFDFLTIGGIIEYSGTQGPSNVKVTTGTEIKFTSDHNEVGAGFKVCSATNGGGLFAMTEGTNIVIEQSRFEHNGASYNGGGVALTNGAKLVDIDGDMLSNDAGHFGGGYFVDSSTLVLVRAHVAYNNATFTTSSGNAAYLQYGQLQGTDISVDSDISGPFASSSATCGSSCSPGSFSTCNAVSGAPICYANCEPCQFCQPGKASLAEGSTSLASCVDCPTGQAASEAASTSCSSCVAGKYAANGSTDLGGGLKFQTLSGASACNDCPVGYFSDIKSAIVCEQCPDSLASSLGSTSCYLAAEGYFLDPSTGESTKCPSNAFCEGGYYVPRPLKGYWVDRTNINFLNVIYKCPRMTCGGAYKLPNKFNQCWKKVVNESYNASCKSDDLLCTSGARGPLCSSCSESYYFSSTEQMCLECGSMNIFSASAVFALIIAATVLLLMKRNSILRYLDGGVFRVLCSTFQIAGEISWALNISFPAPFSQFIALLSIFSLDFITTACIQNSYMIGLVIWSLAPMALEVLNYLVYIFRRKMLPSSSYDYVHQHTSAGVLLAYLVLPPVSRRLLASFDCIQVGDEFYVRIDTSVNCYSKNYDQFRIFVIMSLVVYLSIPIVWALLLWTKRRKFNENNRHYDSSNDSLRFLFFPYRKGFYYWEIIEMFRRIFFIGIIPLITSSSSRRAAIGVLISLCSIALYGEASPFEKSSTNLLVYIAQYSILLTYGGALVISTNISHSLNPLFLGIFLVAINCVVLVLIVVFASNRYIREKRELMLGRHTCNTQELKILADAMDKNGCFSANDGDENPSVVEMQNSSNDLQASTLSLNRLLLNEDSLLVQKRVGAGAFGDVYKGSYLNRIVAIKTMNDVTDDNAKAFRAEIILTSTLRHPNIIAFVGACWCAKITCLVLEWMQRGSLDDFLKSNGGLLWDDPLLSLVCNVARGMAYLHAREYIDDVDGRKKVCIVHRDLKPQNVLISEYLLCKLSDFGISRVKDENNVNMTNVGTPIFAAPEIFNSDGAYDEKVDVYSFGMLLVDVAVDAGGLDKFLVSRWNIEKGRKVRINRVLNAMIQGTWHPISNDNGACLEGIAPSFICDLAARCCSFDPTKRPAFSEIVDLLSSDSVQEAMQKPDGSSFVRRVPDEPQTSFQINALLGQEQNQATEGDSETTHESRKHEHYVQVGHAAVTSEARAMVLNSQHSSSTRGGSVQDNDKDENASSEKFALKLQADSLLDL